MCPSLVWNTHVSDNSHEFLVLLPAEPQYWEDRPVVLGLAPETPELCETLEG